MSKVIKHISFKKFLMMKAEMLEILLITTHNLSHHTLPFKITCTKIFEYDFGETQKNN